MGHSKNAYLYLSHDETLTLIKRNKREIQAMDMEIFKTTYGNTRRH
jgi:hypothetical protein